MFGSMKKDYVHNTTTINLSLPMPVEGSIYFLIINNRRKYAKIKAAMLKKLLTIAEMLAN